MKRILFDTDVLIELLRGNTTVEKEMEELILSNAYLALTPVSLAEIYRGLRSNERSKTQETLSVFECVKIEFEAGKKAGEWMRQYSKTHHLEIADTLIAATAVVHRLSLCTFNWKHFPMREVERFEIER